MTKNLSFIPFLTLALLFASCGARRNAGQDPAIFDEGVVINGIRWATRNVDTPGTFTQNPENVGSFFTFEEAQNACPRGWRLPTYEELQSLVGAGSEWTTKNGVTGRSSRRNSLFLPAAGWHGADGALAGVGGWGGYWSSSVMRGPNLLGRHLLFFSGSSGVYESYSTFGFSVRCVAE